MKRPRITSKHSVVSQMLLYLANVLDPVHTRFDKDLLMQRSWSRTTVLYLIKEVENSDTDPALIVSEFIKSVDRRSGMMFRVAYDVAVDLYDHIFL